MGSAGACGVREKGGLFCCPDFDEFREQNRAGIGVRPPPDELCHRWNTTVACFEYRAATWAKPRRVVVKVEWHRGELYPRVGFIVTNLTWWAGDVVRFYNQRGTAEQWITEGKYALKWTRLSCCRFVANQVRLQLFALAYNLGNFLRRLSVQIPPGKCRVKCFPVCHEHLRARKATVS